MSDVQRRPETKLKHALTKGQPFTVTYPDGRVEKYLSLSIAAAALGVSNKSIHNYLTGFRTPGVRKKKTNHLLGCVFTYCNQ